MQENTNNANSNYQNKLVINQKEIIVSYDIDKTPIKNNSEEKNKQYIDGMIDVLEEESGKKGRLSSDKKNQNKI